ncbi:fucolectin-like [Mercenaria mercenaria]|uniref:fucolectin-like n=1 Tax=Mercenaria mercenaria TaxID=6596 RepID=UPI00234ECF93|nr:fucolectin-like [Mercenaria mercenaria]
MEATTLAYAFVLVIIIGRFCCVLSAVESIRLARNKEFDGLTCPVSKTIFNADRVDNKIQCASLCTEASSCVGVFHHSQTKDCVGCSSFDKDDAPVLEGKQFYARRPQVFEGLEETNVALGKQTAISSISDSHDKAKGVDGNTNQDLKEGSCFHTDKETDPWWRVDLGAMYHIVDVTLFNRIDSDCEIGGCNRRTRDLRLSMGTTLESMNIVGTVPGQIDDIHTFLFPEGKQARYVQVTLEGLEYLHLCEVQVFGFPTY